MFTIYARGGARDCIPQPTANNNSFGSELAVAELCPSGLASLLEHVLAVVFAEIDILVFLAAAPAFFFDQFGSKSFRFFLVTAGSHLIGHGGGDLEHDQFARLGSLLHQNGVPLVPGLASLPSH